MVLWRNNPRQVLLGVVVFCLVLLLLGGHAYQKRSAPRQSFAQPGNDASLQRCAAVTDRHSRVLGGIPGFYVFENLWFNNGTFYLYGDDLPDQWHVMSGFTKLVTSTHRSPHRTPDVCFDGSTIMLNEGAEDAWNGLYHYYHFAAEDLLGGLAAYAAVEPQVEEPERVVIPWDMSWRDKWNINEVVVEGIFDKPVVEKDQWDRMIGQHDWVYFERAAFVDRAASHRNNPPANQWNKMSLPIFLHPHRSGFFTTKRDRLLSHYGILGKQHPCPKVVYIDRQDTSRRMPDEVHVEFLKMLRELERGGYGRFEHVHLEDGSVLQQIAEVADATVMIGIHGNGLTHELWMAQDSMLIELFPNETFLRDYQAVAQALGHEYHAVIGNETYTPERWEANPGEWHAERTHDWTPVEISVPLVRELLVEYLRDRSLACRG